MAEDTDFHASTVDDTIEIEASVIEDIVEVEVETEIIPDASETVKGVVRLATIDESIEGIDDSTAVTPLKLKRTLDIPVNALMSLIDSLSATKADKSEIPTDNNQLANGAGYVTAEYHDDTKQDVISDLDTIRQGAELGSTALQSYTETDPIYTADKPNIALKSEIPTKVSSLINDADYQTATDVANMIASIPQFEVKIVDTLPPEGQKMVLYLVPKTSSSGDDIYDEYIWLENTRSFELVGTTTVDLSDYYTKGEITNLLNEKQDNLDIILIEGADW